ncbi:MAG: ATP-binding protein [Verrucomicrobiales bacterium]|nr:ATP-binding protein [Verrucomicrobiales bacterium]
MELLLANDLNELERLSKSLETFAKKEGLDSAVAYKLLVCLDELVTNVISYGGPRSFEERTRVSVEVAQGKLHVCIEETGAAFNPLLREDPDITADIDSRGIGGLGILLVKKMMDCVEYERRGNRNVLRMTKNLVSEAKDGN